MQELLELAKEFKACQKTLLALGDENRQRLILEMMRPGECDGIRVGVISERTHLSRPAVSHHLQILKEAGLVSMHREGTKNYYCLNANTEAFNQLFRMLSHVKKLWTNSPSKGTGRRKNSNRI